MARVTGVGGIFFKARNPQQLRAWYRDHLGIVPRADGTVAFEWRERETPDQIGFTVWGPFPEDTTYFAPSDKPFMFNFRVDDLDGVLARLRERGVEVDDRIEDYFGWCMDLEGNRLELWEPPQA